MVDPVLVSVAGVGASVVKFLLRASGQDAVAGLVGDAQEGLGLLAGLRGRVNDRGGAVAKCIEKTVADRVRGMYQKCQDRGVGTERLDGVATGVGGLLDRVGNDDRFIVEAVRSPDRFAAMLHRRGEPIRAQLFARSEPYFDELVDAVAAEYVRLAPWSEKFQIEALKYVMGALDRIEEGVGKIQEDVGKGLANDALILESLEIVKENQNATIGGLPRPGRVVFGARPDVAAGFRERVEQGTLRGLVVDGVQERVVLVGMAGSGKSQLASSLARECGAAGWGLVAWLNASSADSVRSDLVELARRLGVDTSDNPTQDQVIERCLGHLQSADAGDRLVVFDNVEDFDDLTGVVPHGGGLRVVATSRRRDVSSAWEAVEVGVFPRADSIAFVQSITGSQDSGAADALAARLGDLPLALAQAAETARIERWSLAEYLDQLDAYSSDRVIHRIPGDSYPDDVSWALLLAVDSALSRIKDGSHEAAGLQVGALAVLAESGVPTRWIAPGARKAQTDGNADGAGEGTNADAGPVGETTKVRAAAAENARRALAALLNASVVQQSTDRGVTMVHRFQGQVLRENWNPGEWAGAFGAATDLLDRIDIDSLPREDAEGRRREVRDLIDQLRAIAAQGYSRPLFECERVVADLPHVLFHARDLGLPDEALALRGAVGVVEEVLGVEHPDSLASRNGLAGAYESAGRLGEAIALYEGVLADRVRVLGDDHPDTLTSRNNLAGAYRAAGRLGEAITLFEEVLADSVRVLGDDHPHTLTSRNNLAYAYRKAGRVNEAIASYEGVLADSVRVLGADHPHTLASRGNLAESYLEAGRVDDAVPLFEGVLADSVRVLGDDHPDTLTSRGNLAYAYRKAGRVNEAIASYEGVLADSVRVLGADHPDTLTSQGNLAGAYESAGRLGEAIPLYEQVLAERRRVLGADHPDTLTSQGNLAGAYYAVGRLDEAIALYEEMVGDSARVLGDDHPHTQRSRSNLAYAYRNAGRFDEMIPLLKEMFAYHWQSLVPDYLRKLTARSILARPYSAEGRLSEAIPLFEKVLADNMRILGPRHPSTLSSRNDLAHAYEEAGRVNAAIVLYEEVLADNTRVLGSEHPDTLASRHNLAGAYRAAGRLSDAIVLYEEVIADRVRVLGPDHPSTSTSRNGLAGAYRAAGRLGEAIPLYEEVLADSVRVLGGDHPDTLSSRNNLALAYESAGRLGEAIVLLEKVFADSVRVLGPDYPDTLVSRSNLAGAYESAGRLGEAIVLLEKVAVDRVRVLGHDHPDTLASRNNLAVCYLKAGRVDEAIALYEKVLADRMRVLGADHPDTLASRDNLETAMRAREAGNASARVPQKKAPPSSGKWLCP